MKWLLLLVIVVVILIIFAVWRRMQAASEPARTASPTADSALEGSSADAPTLATEAGVDEVLPAPASENSPPSQPPPARQGGDAEDWWTDQDGDRR